MSDLLDRRIAEMTSGPRININPSMTESEVRESYEFMLDQLSRLTAALHVLFPDDVEEGETHVPHAEAQRIAALMMRARGFAPPSRLAREVAELRRAWGVR